MSKLSKIIRYFTSHDVSMPLTHRVWKRFGGPIDQDAEQELERLWARSGDSAIDIDKSWKTVSRNIGLRQRASFTSIFFRAAIWIVPVMMMLVAGWLYYDVRRQQQMLAQTDFLQTFCASGSQKHMFLPDSTEVWLNGGSVLLYPSSFTSGNRNVTLVGEAYFKVRHIANSQFQVSVNHLRVTDVGTEFNVQSYPNLDKTVVTLNAGAVSVNIHGRKYSLTPNHQLSFSAKTGIANIVEVAAEEYSIWRTGTICFNNETLPAVLASLEYRYNVRIHLLTHRFDSQSVRLHLNSNEKLGNVMSLLATIVPGMKYEIKGKVIYIR